jgi:hypothetical protein
MLRRLAPNHAGACALAAAGGAAYGAGGLGVPLLYLVIIVASLIALVGYARWDERHFG